MDAPMPRSAWRRESDRLGGENFLFRSPLRYMNISPGFRDRLSGITCAERVLTEPADIWVYGYDNSRKHVPPDVVVFVTSHREVQDIVRLCHEHGVPIVARGRGTAPPGAALPARGG